MRVKIMPLAIAALIACSAFGQPSPDQTVDKVFHFANTTLPQGRAEITNAIRTIAAIQKASVDNGASVLAVSGTAGQIAMAEWLFFEMDKPADAPPPKVAPVEFRVAGAADDVARVFYLVNSPTPQAAQEIVNTIRSLAEIQRILVYNAPKAVAMRGTVEQVAFAEWLIGLLDKPAGPNQDSGPYEYRSAGSNANVARVFYPKYAETPQSLQEIVNLIRSIAEIQRAVMVSGPKALALRGTADQLALTEWLIRELDKPAGSQNQNPAPLEYRIAGNPTPVVRVFYPSHTDTPQALQEVASMVRTTTSIQRLVVYNTTKALTVRGTGDQIARAEQLLKERDKQ